METNNWETVHNTEKKQMIHFFENKNFMVVTDFKKSSTVIVDLNNNSNTTKVDISDYTLDQYVEMISFVAANDKNPSR